MTDFIYYALLVLSIVLILATGIRCLYGVYGLLFLISIKKEFRANKEKASSKRLIKDFKEILNTFSGSFKSQGIYTFVTIAIIVAIYIFSIKIKNADMLLLLFGITVVFDIIYFFIAEVIVKMKIFFID